MDRQIYKFQFKDMERVTEAYMNFINSTFDFSEVEGKTPEEITDSVKFKIGGSLVGTAQLASVLVPIGLRLSPEELAEMDSEEALEYLPEIMEVNSGFFTGLWRTWEKSISKIQTGPPQNTLKEEST